jgi:hypothetical protein
MVLVIRCPTVLEDIDNIKLLLIYSLGSIFFINVYVVVFLFNTAIYVFYFISMYFCCMFMYLHRASWHSSATLTEVFPCFFLSCKANARV